MPVWVTVACSPVDAVTPAGSRKVMDQFETAVEPAFVTWYEPVEPVAV